MAGWKPIATAPREAGRPLLLYPYPFPRGSIEKMDALDTVHKGDRLILDLTHSAVRRMIKLAKKRGYVTHDDELNAVLPPEKPSVEQIEDLLDQLSQMGINVIGPEETQERVQPRIKVEHERATDDQPTAQISYADLCKSQWVIYASVFEGYWDGRRWLTAGGVPCEPTHWTTLPSPPPTSVR